ncbi:hypothetical protein M9H77_34482 [Catharanthus roseus]|uniref:Uncharacterized protein n=1 Tax=Catharanthus roseus TaxID=4058 RepID=A0ACB9ZNG7_CATRO|nr:hypothetical protein M9H77_34482 [Catharanthus roseus]
MVKPTKILSVESPARPVVRTNIEYSGMVSSEGHTHEGSEDELIVVKNLKGKSKKRVRESARIRELSESSKKTRLTKSDVGLISAEKALNDIFYDKFHAKKYTLVKTRGMIVENYFVEENDSISDVESNFNVVMYVRKEVVDFNVEELSAFLDIPIYSKIEGSELKEEVDLDMVTREVTEGYKITWPVLCEKRVTKKIEADIKKARKVEARSKPPLKSFKSNHLLQLCLQFAAYRESLTHNFVIVEDLVLNQTMPKGEIIRLPNVMLVGKIFFKFEVLAGILGGFGVVADEEVELA